MTAPAYVDTSALAKWYLSEKRSDEVESFLGRIGPAAISRLVTLEFRCLLARRRRAREINGLAEERTWSAFQDDIRAGFLSVHPLEDAHVLAADELLVRLRRLPLRTLDAIHLAIATDLRVPLIATADRVMALAAEALGLRAARFD